MRVRRGRGRKTVQNLHFGTESWFWETEDGSKTFPRVLKALDKLRSGWGGRNDELIIFKQKQSRWWG